ncbi:MAG: outer membrane protein [bacterium]|nr:MAG: outer membrane protein [bacterium]
MGGDVKVIFPAVEIKYFRPIIKREKPQVLGMRLLVEKVISFGEPPTTNSLAFIDGVPIFNRFFLGGEDTLRGYNVRSISPIARLERFFTATDVRAVELGTNRVIPVIKPGRRFFTFNNKLISNPNFPEFTPVGADTQILYNLEYRIPIAGPLTMALFADAGTAFNTASISDQSLVQNPFVTTIPDDPSALFQQSVFILNPRGLIASQKEVNDARTPETPFNALPKGFRFVTFQGRVTNSTSVKLGDAIGGIGQNFRSSIGAEVRVQVPVVGVPFRLIFAYNPNAKTNRSDPRQIFVEEKKVIRFSIGRTF